MWDRDKSSKFGTVLDVPGQLQVWHSNTEVVVLTEGGTLGRRYIDTTYIYVCLTVGKWWPVLLKTGSSNNRQMSSVHWRVTNKGILCSTFTVWVSVGQICYISSMIMSY